jgi:hypothetical protein
MDLLGRKSRRKLEEYAVLAAGYVKLLQSKNDVARNRINLIEIENHNLKNEVIRLKLELEAAKPKPIKNHPLYLNETEEDIEFAYKNELIDRAEYEDMLRQLEFDNTDITFDLEAL